MQPDIGALYLKYRQTMRAVASSVLRDTAHRDDVDDVLMDVVTTLVEKPPSKQVTNWEAYLVRATRNKAIDLLRSAAARRAGGPVEEHHHPAIDQYLADDVAEHVDSLRAGALVWDVLAVLEDRERKILWHYKALGLPRAEVAAAFGIDPSRVSQISTAALKKMREALPEEGDQP